MLRKHVLHVILLPMAQMKGPSLIKIQEQMRHRAVGRADLLLLMPRGVFVMGPSKDKRVVPTRQQKAIRKVVKVEGGESKGTKKMLGISRRDLMNR